VHWWRNRGKEEKKLLRGFVGQNNAQDVRGHCNSALFEKGSLRRFRGRKEDTVKTFVWGGGKREKYERKGIRFSYIRLGGDS